MRTRAFTLAVSVVVVLAACSDNPTTSARRRQGAPADPLRTNIQPSGTLDQNITYLIGALFPTGLEDAAGDRWDNVKQKYAAGLTDPSQMKVARTMVVNLTNWVLQKESRMTIPAALQPEPVSSAASRLAQYMALYVYLGPGTPVPPYFPGQDAAFGVVTPTTSATIVTPSLHAGVAVDAGSVSENTIITVVQNPNEYPVNCTGPLDTPYCQYPQFYTFDQFPHVAFLKPVHVGVCHVNSGDFRAPLAGTNHDYFRFAHPAPAAADATPGGVFVGNIEVLPLITQAFVRCSAADGTPNSAYTLPSAGSSDIGMRYERATRLVGRLASRIVDLLAPRTAQAIDQGGGADMITFSPVNVVDTTSRPDFGIQNLGVSATEVQPGATITVSFDVVNVGTARGDELDSLLLGTDPSLQSASGSPSGATDSLPPGGRMSRTSMQITVPTTPGTYYVGGAVHSYGTLPDPNAANNTASVAITVLGQVIGARSVPRKWMVASAALTDSRRAQ